MSPQSHLASLSAHFCWVQSPLSPAELAKEEGNAMFRNAQYEKAIEKYGRYALTHQPSYENSMSLTVLQSGQGDLSCHN